MICPYCGRSVAKLSFGVHWESCPRIVALAEADAALVEQVQAAVGSGRPSAGPGDAPPLPRPAPALS